MCPAYPQTLDGSRPGGTPARANAYPVSPRDPGHPSTPSWPPRSATMTQASLSAVPPKRTLSRSAPWSWRLLLKPSAPEFSNLGFVKDKVGSSRLQPRDFYWPASSLPELIDLVSFWLQARGLMQSLPGNSDHMWRLPWESKRFTSEHLRGVFSDTLASLNVRPPPGRKWTLHCVTIPLIIPETCI